MLICFVLGMGIGRANDHFASDLNCSRALGLGKHLPFFSMAGSLLSGIDVSLLFCCRMICYFLCILEVKFGN